MKNLSAEELQEKLDENGIMLINVLDEEHFSDCHITDSVNIPYKSNINESMTGIDKDCFIVTYCASFECSASKQAAQKIEALGFTNVHTYEGGMKEWIKKGFSCEGACEKKYLTS